MIRLKQCYVEDFGCLHQYSLTFEPGITTLHQSNGSGKSTLAAFLRAMFYGFPRGGGALERDLRKRYLPWQGGSFGGWLEFSFDGTDYRIERTFGQRPAQDTFALYQCVPRKKCDRWSSGIGEEIFGLDADSFERTAFLTQNRISGSLSTGRIRSLLGDETVTTAEADSYDHALRELRVERSRRIPYRGRGGTVDQLSGELSSVRLRLQEAEIAGRQLEDCRRTREEQNRQLDECLQKKKDLEQALAEAISRESTESVRREWNRLQTQERQVQSQLQELAEHYPAGLPTWEELQSAAQWWNLPQAAPAAGLATGTGGPETTDSGRTQNPATGQRTDSGRTQNPATGQRELQGFSRPAGILCGAIAVVCLTAAVLLLARDHVIAGLLLLLPGLTALSLPHIRKHRENKDTEGDKPAAPMAEDPAENPVATTVEDPTENPSFPTLEDPAENPDPAAPAAAAAAQQRRDFLARCHREDLAEDPTALLILERDRSRQIEWEEQLHNLQTEKSALLRQYPRLDTESDVSSILCADGSASALSADSRLSSSELQKLCSEVSAQHDRLREAAAEISHRQEQLQEKADRQTELTEKLQQLTGQLQTERENARLLDQTILLLQQARDSLSLRYLHRVRDRFLYYRNLMDPGQEESEAELDAELNITLRRAGGTRELGYFSTGSVDLLLFCLRLALIDALYEESRPFLILDDPFTCLDDDHLETALQLLEKLSGNTQILYLVCCGCRTI